MEERVALHLGTATAHVVDVVTLESNQVARAGEVQAPVVVAVAGGGVVCLAVEVAIGDGDAFRGILA